MLETLPLVLDGTQKEMTHIPAEHHRFGQDPRLLVICCTGLVSHLYYLPLFSRVEHLLEKIFSLLKAKQVYISDKHYTFGEMYALFSCYCSFQ